MSKPRWEGATRDTCPDSRPHEWVSDKGWEEKGEDYRGRKDYDRTSICVRCMAKMIETIVVPSEDGAHPRKEGICECLNGKFCQEWITKRLVES